MCRCEPSGLAKLLWGCAHLRAAHATLTRTLTEEAAAKLRAFKAQELSNVAWSCATLALADSPVVGGLLAEVRGKLRSFEPQGLANLAWSFAVLVVADPEALSALGEEAIAKMDGFKAQELSGLAWALAKGGGAAHAGAAAGGGGTDAEEEEVAVAAPLWPHIFRAIAGAAMHLLGKGTFAPQGLANLAWAFSRAAWRDPDLYHILAQGAMLNIGGFTSQGLANLAWAFAAAGYSDEALLSAVGGEAVGRLGDFRPEELSGLAWAFATARTPAPALLPALAASASRLLAARRFGLGPLAGLAWALAAHGGAGDGGREVLIEIAEQSAVLVAEFKSQELSNIAWAMATETVRPVPLLRALQEQVVRSGLGDFAPQHLCNLAWAFARLEWRAGALFHGLARRASGSTRDFTAQGVSNLAWAFAVASHCSEGLLVNLAREAHRRIHEFSPQGLSNLAWAFGTLVVADCGLFHAIALAAGCQIASFKAQEAASLLWAFAILAFDDVAARGFLPQHLLTCLELCSMLEVSEIMWSFAALRIYRKPFDDVLSAFMHKMDAAPVHKPSETNTLAEVPEAVTSAIWAAHHAGMPVGRLLKRARALLTECGAIADAARPMAALSGGQYLRPATLGADGPQFLCQLPDRAVILKSPGWEVDNTAVPSRFRPLSLYMQAQFPCRTHPILADVGCQRGFLGRLDVPNGGLVLVATTYVAWYDLQLQLHSGALMREYVILCHGWTPTGRGQLSTRIWWSGAEGAPSQVCRWGRPSESAFEVLAHVCSSEGSAFSLLGVRIATGRRHQIRLHGAYVGHPTLRDGKYASAATFVSARRLCERNFLHRHRLTFSDARGTRWDIRHPLPPDLAAVVGGLSPRGRRDEQALREHADRG